MEPDFSGYATKAGLECSDGLTITPDAFKHQDKVRVPLVWQHGHSSSDNVLGHAILEARADGIYAYGYFNDTSKGRDAKKLVQHQDITALSIFANNLVKKSKMVLHGAIREVSLVLAGANPGALIDFISIAHSDDTVEVLEDEAIITTGLELEHESPRVEEEALAHAATGDLTVQDIYDSMSPEQQEVTQYLIGAALESAGVSHSNVESDNDLTPQEQYERFSDSEKELIHSMMEAVVEEAKASAIAEHSATNTQEGNLMNHNVFEQGAGAVKDRPTLSHDQLKTIVEDAGRLGKLSESFLAHAGEYGIDNIDLLFPDATLDSNGVSIISRRMDWVQDVLSNTKHSPFSRIKSLAADLTADEARAKGYVKGNLKKDEVIKLLKRVTTPKTIYKKQKLDRDDIVDITTIDIVAWLKAEMRVMLDEEIARAVLVGDNRAADDEDKIDEDHIRPIAYDVDMYNTTVNLAVDIAPDALVEAIVRSLRNYKGTGTPTFYTTQDVMTNMLLSKDTLGRRFYATKVELAGALMVKDIVVVEAMEQDTDLVGVIVNLADYTIGADAGGNVAMFDDFDIDYNQQKYLIETRISGALTKPKAAITLKRNSGRVVTPTTPTFVKSTGVLTVPTQTGVVYTNAATGTTLAAGAQSAIASGATIDVLAIPATGYGFTHDADDEWAFTRD